MNFLKFALRSAALFCVLGISPELIVCQSLPASSKEAQAKQLPSTTSRIRNGVTWTSGDLSVKLQFFSTGTVRVVKWPAGGTSEKTSLSVIQNDAAELKMRFEENPSAITLDSGQIKVQLSKRDGTISFLGSDGHTILQEQGNPSFIATQIAGEESAYNVEQNFKLTPEEGVYGLGQHQYGYMNYRGRTVKLVQANSNAVTPFLVSTAGYGIFWDNYSKTIFSDNSERASFWSEVADNIDYYFLYGPTMDQVIAGYRRLTGQAPMYGKWAFGYWQSKEHYASREELLDVAQQYRRRRIPIDNIVQDWNYWGGNSMWGGMVFDEAKYPHPKEMIDLLHQQNFHIMISIWAGLGPASAIYQDMDRRGYLFPTVGWAGFRYFDPYNPAATDLYWQYANKGLFSKGIDAWWMDSTEPDLVNALTKEATEYEMKRVGRNHLGTFARYLNTFPLLTTEAVYLNQRKETDRKRVYILTRSAFAGQQRAGATTWSGDIGASWDIFRKQIPAGINHSMAGIPYWTFDIGGFFLGSQGGVFTNGGKDPAYQEAYTRMFQFGAFCPIFRSHGTDTPREVWQFSEYIDALVKADNLRYRLLPYIYSLGWQVTNNGYSIMRGLPMDFTNDRKTYSIDDQFMFGPAIMVSPVTEYMYHRPPEAGILITPEHFKTKDGKPGLTVKYYSDNEFKNLCKEEVEPDINLDWYTGWPSFITSPKFSIRWGGKLIPTQTGAYRFIMKSWGPKRVYLDGKELAHHYDSAEADTIPVQMEAGKAYEFTFETSNSSLGAVRAKLFWKTPEIFAKEAAGPETRQKTRTVYLPAGTKWIDFWTGESLSGGKSVVVDAPIDKIPLMVRSGSIIPMGPFLQYATEKAANPIELRIYPGADASFTLYEDENDNYDYEKGVYSTIDFHWNDAKHELTVDSRKGEFPGMLKARTFQAVVVSSGHGGGVEITEKPNVVISYQGEQQIVKINR